MRYFIEARKTGAELTSEEEAEREKLVAELYGKVNPNDIIDPTLYDEDGNLKTPENDGTGEMQAVEAEGLDAVAESMSVEATSEIEASESAEAEPIEQATVTTEE